MATSALKKNGYNDVSWRRQMCMQVCWHGHVCGRSNTHILTYIYMDVHKHPTCALSLRVSWILLSTIRFKLLLWCNIVGSLLLLCVSLAFFQLLIITDICRALTDTVSKAWIFRQHPEAGTPISPSSRWGIEAKRVQCLVLSQAWGLCVCPPAFVSLHQSQEKHVSCGSAQRGRGHARGDGSK